MTGAVPRDACRLFGPDPPPVGEDGAAGRAAFPDPSGGYRIPLRIIEPDDDAIVMTELRVSCGVAGATQALSAAFRRRYRVNVAPTIELALTEEGGAPLGSSAAVGQRISLSVSVPSCPEEDVCGDGTCGIDEETVTCPSDCGPTARSGCGGRERYLRYDAASAELAVERESLRLAWYATGGQLAIERNGLASDEATAPLTNTWTASEPGEVTLIVVARDDRGGASWTTQTVTVE